jgi:hypothetical protein
MAAHEAKPVVPVCVDGCGHTRTALGDLRIRRLGVRVPPGVPLKPLRRKGFSLPAGPDEFEGFNPFQRTSPALNPELGYRPG